MEHIKNTARHTQYAWVDYGGLDGVLYYLLHEALRMTYDYIPEITKVLIYNRAL